MPMTLRILKKKSKQAAEILTKHYADQISDIFLAERCENYHGLVIRCGCPKRDDDLRRCDHQWHPLPGTPMTGEVSGYYEPEWNERTAWETLWQLVHWGERPATMTDREWWRTKAITGTEPVDVDALVAEWEREDALDAARAA
ncbi:hypothetical protein [Methylobacterium nodulans]|uniref:Uncharacterized protein n=1 Tax=Methylobacterium nodulans (strain LMG 21967 / CNCM I-2342 / ORS 2060) TaxID=460265 RepID=B8INY6_METNO|nr:hypothetical protein [Methylobacterium nodulans]ACL58502.1 hypothetical protein Mnod_3593 [Methylobacterium nodulans ORS 2060]